jgi:hypothetical protein
MSAVAIDGKLGRAELRRLGLVETTTDDGVVCRAMWT